MLKWCLAAPQKGHLCSLVCRSLHLHYLNDKPQQSKISVTPQLIRLPLLFFLICLQLSLMECYRDARGEVWFKPFLYNFQKCYFEKQKNYTKHKSLSWFTSDKSSRETIRWKNRLRNWRLLLVFYLWGFNILKEDPSVTLGVWLTSQRINYCHTIGELCS